LLHPNIHRGCGKKGDALVAKKKENNITKLSVSSLFKEMIDIRHRNEDEN
jgi:hypothetical protein